MKQPGRAEPQRHGRGHLRRLEQQHVRHRGLQHHLRPRHVPRVVHAAHGLADRNVGSAAGAVRHVDRGRVSQPLDRQVDAHQEHAQQPRRLPALRRDRASRRATWRGEWPHRRRSVEHHPGQVRADQQQHLPREQRGWHQSQELVARRRLQRQRTDAQRVVHARWSGGVVVGRRLLLVHREPVLRHGDPRGTQRCRMWAGA